MVYHVLRANKQIIVQYSESGITDDRTEAIIPTK